MMAAMGDSENMGGCNTAGLSRVQCRVIKRFLLRDGEVEMASSRSKLRVAVRALLKTRERTRRRIRRRNLVAR
jgi:hypothetical protein